MRKSLGAKRKQIAEDQIAEIVRLYGERAEGERLKIFPNESFGFMRITVERPLRLRWDVSAETLALVEASKLVAKLPASERDQLLVDLGKHEGHSFTKLKEARRVVLPAVAGMGKPTEKAVLDALAVRDPEADVVTDAKGNAEPDPDLRDQENLPLPDGRVGFVINPSSRLATLEYRTAVDDYMTAEVLRYVPDAWVDHDKTRIGYEIPVTRYFYIYVPPRPLAEIVAEIEQLEAEIQELLREVTE